MKKFFLIPLMTMLCTVMAFADNVAKIGETEYATVAEAIADAENGATITLLANAGGNVTLSKDITLNGDKKFTGNITIGASEVTLTLAGVTIDVTGNDAIVHLGKTLNVVVADGTTNAIYAKSSGCDCFYGINNGRLNISGNGTLEVYGYEAIHVSYMNLSAPNATYGASKTLMYDPQIVSATISAGTFDREFPDSYVSAPLFIEKVSSSYVVSNIGANKAVYNYTAYATLQAAVDAAAVGATIVMYADDNTETTVDKPLTIEKKGHSVNTSAGSGIALKAETSSSISYIYQSLKDFTDFLTAEGTNSLVVTEDIDISTAGAIFVNGDKTLTINEGVTVTYKRMTGEYADNICIPAGAKLTILGNGTFSGNNRAIATYGGELVIGPQDQSTQPHFVSTRTDGGCIIESAGGTVTINNIDVYAACIALWVEGEGARMIVNGGRIEADGAQTVDARNGGYYEQNGGTLINNTSTNHGIYSYALMAAANGTMVLNGGSVSGVHGGINASYSGAHVTIYGGSYETRACSYGGASHYAVYVSDYGVVDIHGGDFKSYDKTAMLCGNNDAHSELGVINLYGGRMATKATVQKVPANNTFPASIPPTSQWYSSITVGSGNYGQVPLPAGYEYYETGDETYPWGVQAVEGKDPDAIAPDQKAAQELDPTYTIPWQQATTWAAAVVPEENTIVTIPVDATVTVKNDPGLSSEAVADQVFVSQGATLKVETGTTLNIGEGGMNIGNGGQIVVEPGAVVTVGEAGIITTEDEALVIEATEEDQGVLLLHPEVTENTQPKATVKLVTKCKQVGANEFVWERFAIPTLDGAQTTFNAERLDTVTIYGGGSFEQGLYEWDGSAWAGVSNWHNLMPFKGYQLTNNSMYGNVVYTFEGNLAGNVDMGYEFAESGFGFFGNSYTGDIDILKFFESFGSDMQKTIWIYDYYTDGFKAITETSYGSVYYGKRNARHGLITDVRSMQAFLMNTFATGASVQNVDYSAAIWGNPKYGLVPTPTPAPAKRVAANEDKFTVYVAGAKQEDEVTFIRSNAYSAAFDNGADASKWMNKGLNLYVATEDGELASVASNEIVDMTIAFQSGNETEYTLGFDNLKGEQFELRDILTGATIQMTEGATYTFSQEANTTVPARFQIIGARKVATGVENASEGAAVQQKVIENGVLYILRDNKWYNAQGQIVK